MASLSRCARRLSLSSAFGCAYVSIFKRTTVWAAVLVAGLLLGWLWLTPRAEPQPEYNGKPLSVWLEDFDHWAGYSNDLCVVAVRAMGTNVIPHLVRMSLTAPSNSRRWIWRLGATYPTLSHRLLGNRDIVPPAIYQQNRARTALAAMGPSAFPAIAPLVRALVSSDPITRANAIATLGYIGPRAEAALPQLLALHKDQAGLVRASLMLSLAEIGRQPDMCRPVLTNALGDTDAQVRRNASDALATFGRWEPGVRFQK